MVLLRHIIIIIRLFFLYFKLCYNDIIENYNVIKTRYMFETDKELLEIQKDLEENEKE